MKQLSIKISDELYELISKAAETDNRSVTNLVRNILDNHGWKIYNECTDEIVEYHNVKGTK